MSLLRAAAAALLLLSGTVSGLPIVVDAEPLLTPNLRTSGDVVVIDIDIDIDIDIATDEIAIATATATVINEENAQLVESMENLYEEYGCLSSWGDFPSININSESDPQAQGRSESTTTRDPTKKLGMACMCGMLHDSASLMIEEFMFDDVISSSSSLSSSWLSASPISLSSAIAAANSTENSILTRPTSDQQQTVQSSSLQSPQPSFANIVQSLDLEKTCIDGKAGEFECNNVDLIAHLPLNFFVDTNTDQSPTNANDVWGWTHESSGREFVLWCTTQGAFFVEVTDFGHIKISGYLPSSNGGSSPWRDLKVIGDYAYVGAEMKEQGMQVFDLTRLLNAECVSEFYCKEFTADTVYFGTEDVPVKNTHNVVANPDTNYIYLVGGSRKSGCGGGLHIVDVSNPLQPTFVACYDNDGYVHDAQCVVYDGPDTNYQEKEICFCFNEDTVTIVDVTDKLNMTELSRTTYEGYSYTHQGWVSSDMKHVIFGDEIDEYDNDGQTRTLILNIIDLTAPTNFQEYFGTTTAIDHNLYIANAEAQGYGTKF